VRLKSKSARSEEAGVAMLNGLVRQQICAAPFCGFHLRKSNSSMHSALLQ
jgi:hypothetical protein